MEESTQMENTNSEPILKGTPVSPGVVEGVVRVVERFGNDPDFKEGEILVTPMTEPTMVIMMNKAAGIITDVGGVTSHASIVSRELGIPCVVNTREGTEKMKNGMKVKVDGDKGEIYLLENE